MSTDNWCFWIVVLEKTLGSHLDSKEIKTVNPKGNQSWIFIGRTNSEAEAPILWPPDMKNWLFGKDPGAGKDWRQEGKRMPGDEIVGWHHWLDGCEFEQAPGVDDCQGSLAAAVYGVTKSWTWMSSWTELMVEPRLVETKWLYRIVLGEIIVDRYKLQTLLTTKL